MSNFIMFLHSLESSRGKKYLHFKIHSCQSRTRQSVDYIIFFYEANINYQQFSTITGTTVLFAVYIYLFINFVQAEYVKSINLVNPFQIL